MANGYVKLKIYAAGYGPDCREYTLPLRENSPLKLVKENVGVDSCIEIGIENGNPVARNFKTEKVATLFKNRKKGSEFSIKTGDWLETRGLKIRISQILTPFPTDLPTGFPKALHHVATSKVRSMRPFVQFATKALGIFFAFVLIYFVADIQWKSYQYRKIDQLISEATKRPLLK